MNKLVRLTLLSFYLIFAHIVVASEDTPHYSTLEEETLVVMNTDFSITVKTKKTIIIWDKKGRNHGNVHLPSDQFTTIDFFEAVLSNPATGKTIKKFKKKDLQEYNIVNGGTFYSDFKQTYFFYGDIDLPAKFVVEYQYTQEGNFNIPYHFPVSFSNQKVKKSRFEFQYPESVGLKYKPIILEEPVKKSMGGDLTSLIWESSDFEILDEDDFDNETPHILFAPVKVKMENFAGEMETWNGMATWMGQLLNDKEKLPEEFAAKVRSMTEGVTDEFEKVTILYQYLQKNYRYVSIQLGIGGWMPTAAPYTITNKYGECKALTILMKGMLKEVGIESQYTLVKAGNNKKPIYADFPSNQFNHAFLRLPMGEDVYWLECTSQYGIPGFSGNFTANRDVLVVTEEGGFLDRTPDYSQLEYNTIKNNFVIEISQSNNAKILGHTQYTGYLGESFRGSTFYRDTEGQQAMLKSFLDMKGLVLDSFKIENKNLKICPITDVYYNGLLLQFSQETTKRITIPNIWSKIQLDMIYVGVLNLETELNLKTEHELETGHFDTSINEEYYTIHHFSKPIPDGIQIIQKVNLNIPPDLSDKEQNAIIAKLNTQSNRSLMFKKSQL